MRAPQVDMSLQGCARRACLHVQGPPSGPRVIRSPSCLASGSRQGRSGLGGRAGLGQGGGAVSGHCVFASGSSGIWVWKRLSQKLVLMPNPGRQRNAGAGEALWEEWGSRARAEGLGGSDSGSVVLPNSWASLEEEVRIRRPQTWTSGTQSEAECWVG